MCCENSKGPENFSVWDSEALLAISKINVATSLFTSLAPLPPHTSSLCFSIFENMHQLLEGSCQRKALRTLCCCSRSFHSSLLCDNLKPGSSVSHLESSIIGLQLPPLPTAAFLCPVSKTTHVPAPAYPQPLKSKAFVPTPDTGADSILSSDLFIALQISNSMIGIARFQQRGTGKKQNESLQDLFQAYFMSIQTI